MGDQLVRRSVALAALGGGFASFLSGCGHRVVGARTPRIGFMIGVGYPTMEAAFRDELTRLGYIEGQNLSIETRISTSAAQLQTQAAELARMDLDMIVAAALPQALAVRAANPDMRMVVGTAAGLVTNGFAQSLERPGGNVTGMDELPPGLTGNRLRLLKSAAPLISRVGLLSTTPGRGGHEAQLLDAEHAAGELGLSVTPYRATSPAEVESALAAMARDDVGGMLNFQGGLSLGLRDTIVRFAAEHRIPAMYQSRLFAEAGGLMAYAPDQDEQFRMAARYVDRILKRRGSG
jgi:putative tryptophan/tyrosine transport system substrate-binding protein